jgi:hypothetical protein
MADARWRIRRMQTEERIRRAVELQRAWGSETPVTVM